jgi:hypothetical protein
MVYACAERDRQQVVGMSVALGFLTGTIPAGLLNVQPQTGVTPTLNSCEPVVVGWRGCFQAACCIV